MRTKTSLSLLVLYFVFSQYSILRSQVPLQDSIFNLYLEFIQSKNEVKRIETGKHFFLGLKSALAHDPKMEFAFDSLKKYKVMLESPDKQVRIFTWDLLADDATHTYFGLVQAYNRKSKKYEVYELKDKSEGMRDPENAFLDNTKWFGAYYYELTEVKYKKKKYYILFGWDGNTMSSDKRIIEVLHFDSKGFPKFGDAIFINEKGKLKKRIIFEYQAGVVMTLRYDEGNQGIIFDHLSPSDPGLEGQYEFYGPDFSYDMLRFKDGKWHYEKNVEARNPKDKMDKHFKSPK